MSEEFVEWDARQTSGLLREQLTAARAEVEVLLALLRECRELFFYADFPTDADGLLCSSLLQRIEASLREGRT